MKSPTKQRNTQVSETGTQSALDLSKTSSVITTAYSGDVLVSLVNSADSRDALVGNAPIGAFVGVVSGSVDVCMAMADAMLKYSESIEDDKSGSSYSRESQFDKVQAFAISVLDVVYSPNCVNILVYSSDVDWDVSVSELLAIADTPTGRVLFSKTSPQSEIKTQWIDLRHQLMNHCRNPKRDKQLTERLAVLEAELKETTKQHSFWVDKFAKDKGFEKQVPNSNDNRATTGENGGDSAGSVSIPSAGAVGGSLEESNERKRRLRRIVLEQHRVIDPAVRTKRDTILWGGQPHAMAPVPAAGRMRRRLSRFGFRSEEEVSSSSEGTVEDGVSSSGGTKLRTDETATRGRSLEKPPLNSPTYAPPVGCAALFRCCISSGSKKKK